MLSNRLTAVYNAVIDSEIIADVCTDHAFLPIELVKNNKVKKAYACDIAEGPLEFAKSNIIKENLEDKITTMLTDGIQNLPKEVDTLVIAGIGYYTVEEILNHDIEKLYNFKRIVVQVNKDVRFLRQWISDHHFTILDETIVYEALYYQIISFNTNFHRTYSFLEISLGPILMERNEPLFIEYLEYLLLNMKDIYSHVPKQTKKSRVLQENIKSLESVLNIE
jgi:tRNA (adenine22-N1)-methyltransferase